MKTGSNVWRELSRSKKFREEFAALQLKRGVPFQIRALLKSLGWKQETLAEKAGLSQGVVSRAQNPEYGNLTLNTIIRIAAGFDVAFVGKFVPFSELVDWFENLSEESAQVRTFEQESKESGQEARTLWNRRRSRSILRRRRRMSPNRRKHRVISMAEHSPQGNVASSGTMHPPLRTAVASPVIGITATGPTLPEGGGAGHVLPISLVKSLNISPSSRRACGA